MDPDSPSGMSAAVWRLVDRSRITPNAVTIIGFLGICAAAVLTLERLWVIASLVFIASGLVDSLDGLVARHQGRVTTFGAFLDSTLDRLAEGVILGAIGITFAQDDLDWALGAGVRRADRVVPGLLRTRPRGGSRHPRLERRPDGPPGAPGDRRAPACSWAGWATCSPVLMCILAGLSLLTAAHRVLLVWRASDGRGA